MADLPLIGGFFSSFFSQTQDASPQSSDDLSVVKNPSFEEGAPNFFDKLLKRPVAVVGWGSVGKPTLSINDQKTFIKKGQASLNLEGSEGTGITQVVEVPSKKLLSYSISVYVEKGTLTFAIKDASGAIVGQTSSTKQKSFETLMLTPYSKGENESQKYTLEFTLQDKENGVYLDDVSVADVGKTSQACDPFAQREFSGCTFYQECRQNGSSPAGTCYKLPPQVWKNNLTDAQATAIFEFIKGADFQEFPAPIEFFFPVVRINRINDIYMGQPYAQMGAICGLAGTAGCPPLSDARVMATLVSLTTEGLIQANYPDFSHEDVMLMAERMRAVQRQKSARALYEYMLISCDTGGPCLLGQITSRLGVGAGHLFPTWVKEGVASMMERGSKHVGVKVTELLGVIGQGAARNAARISPMIKNYIGKLYLYVLDQKFPLLKGLDRPYSSPTGKAFAYYLSDLTSLYPQFNTAWNEIVTNHMAPYNISPFDVDVFVASSTEDFYMLYNLTQSLNHDFVAGWHSFNTLSGRHTIVINPGQLVQFGDQALFEILEHEVLHIGLFKHGGEQVIDLLLNQVTDPAEKTIKRKILTELISASMSGGYEDLIRDFKNQLASMIANDPAIRQQFKLVFRIPNNIPENQYANYIRIKIIQPAFQGIISAGSHPDSIDYGDFTIRWKSVTGMQFHDWLFAKLPKPLPKYFEKMPADVIKKHEENIAKGKIQVEALKAQNPNFTFNDGLCRNLWEGCGDDLPQYQTVLVQMLRNLQDSNTVTGFGLPNEPIISSESLVEQLQLVPLTARFQDGILTRAEVDEVTNMRIALDFEEPLTVPVQFYEPNSWDDPIPPFTIDPGQPTLTPSTNRRIDVDVQNQAGDLGGINRMGVAVYENGGWVGDYLSDGGSITRYTQALDRLSAGSEYRIEPRAKDGQGNDVSEQYVVQRASDCQGGEASGDRKACMYRSGQSGTATFVIQPSDQPIITMTPTPTRPIGGGPTVTPSPTPVPPTPTIVAAPGSTCAYVSGPSQLVRGASGSMVVKFYNTGNFAWNRQNHGDPSTQVKVKAVQGTELVGGQYQSPIYLTHDVPFCTGGQVTDSCSTTMSIPVIADVYAGVQAGRTYPVRVQLHRWNGSQDISFGAICGRDIQVVNPAPSLTPTRVPSPTRTPTPTVTPTITLTPTPTTIPSPTADTTCYYSSQIQLALNNAAGDPPSTEVQGRIQVDKLVKRAGSDVWNGVWGGVFGGSPFVWNPTRLPVTIGGRQITPGDTVETNLYVPSDWEVVASRNRVASCVTGNCGSIQPTSDGVTIMEPMSCQPNLSTQRLTYQVFIQPVQPKSWTIKTQAMCPDGTIPPTYNGSVGVAVRERDGARAVTWNGWDTPRSGQHTTTITSTRAGDTILLGLSDDSQAGNSLLFRGVVDGTNMPAANQYIAAYGYHPELEFGLGKFTSWNRDTLPAGTYTIGMQAPDYECEGHMTGDSGTGDSKTGTEGEPTPLPVPTPVDTHPVVEGTVAVSTATYMDTTPLRGGQEVTLTLPTTEDTLERIVLYYKSESAPQGFSTDPSQGWTTLQTLNCQTDDCTTRQRTISLPEGIQAGTYTIAVALFDHTRPQAGEHFGTIAQDLIEGTALESVTRPCTEAPETATYCTADGLSTTIVVE